MRMRFVAILIGAAVALCGAQGSRQVRKPAVVGKWYPETAETLRATIQRYTDAAGDLIVPPGKLVACVVPNGPYGFSGDIAAQAFKLLEPGQYDRVIVMTGSHFASFRGCSIASVGAYRTPLGDVPLDEAAIRRLTFSPLITSRSLRRTRSIERTQLHEVEYGIEVVLPFLQARLGTFRLVPIVVGDLLDYRGRTDAAAIRTIVRKLREVIDDRTLLVVSSNFTHHGNAYSYRPFDENIIEGVEDLDRRAFRLLLRRDHEGFQAYLEETKNTIDGKVPLAMLMRLLPRQCQGQLLAHDVSARRTKDTRNAVGYGALIFVDPTQPPLSPAPEASSAN